MAFLRIKLRMGALPVHSQTAHPWQRRIGCKHQKEPQTHDDKIVALTVEGQHPVEDRSQGGKQTR